MRPSFTILEIIIVIVLITIMITTINISIPDNKLNLASDTLKRYLNHTKSLALKNDKYLPIPNNSSEENMSKYWFKRFWQLRIGFNGNDYYVVVFNDDNLDGKILKDEKAKDPLNKKYIDGNYYSPTSDKDANLSNFNITKVTYKYKGHNYSIKNGEPLNILFDNFGNVYICQVSNNSCTKDINIFKSLNIITSNIEINLSSNNKYKLITITPAGEIY